MPLFQARPDWFTAQHELLDWYSTSLGESVLNEMLSSLDRLLPDIFGYQGLQVGQISQKINLLESAGLHRRVIMGHGSGVGPDLLAGDALNLPIAADTMNLVLMPHTLDFCENPHQALREADRVLRSDGHLVIIGYNPHSSWGLRHMLGGWRGNVPWSGEFYSRWRVSEWLSVLSFRVVRTDAFYLRLPMSGRRLLQSTRFMENARPLLGRLGACYVIHARKQTIPMTQIRDTWRRPAAGLATGSLVQRAGVRRLSSTVTDIRKVREKSSD